MARKHLKPNVIFIDTAAAFFPGENENDNNENGEYARQLRTLCNLPGNPTVIVLCHPTKSAKDLNEMVPRGGGAFLNEVDGNIGVLKAAPRSLRLQLASFGGPEFLPLNFALKGVTHPKLVTSAGKSIPTVIAEPISYDEVQRRDETGRKNEDKALEMLCNNPKGMIQADIAKSLSWYDNKAKRALKSLAGRKARRLYAGPLDSDGEGAEAPKQYGRSHADRVTTANAAARTAARRCANAAQKALTNGSDTVVRRQVGLTSFLTCQKRRVRMSENSKNNNDFKDMTVSITCQTTLSVGGFIPS